jgi:hypothetical protein
LVPERVNTGSQGASIPDMNIDTRFLRLAAVSAFASAVTTSLLIFLPELFAPATGFEARMARVQETAYTLRAWTYLLHPFLVFTASLGMALVLGRHAPMRALAGILGFMLWAFTEVGQQTFTLFAFDRWRVAWEGADEATRAAIRVNTVMYDGIWDGMYVLLLIGFAIGNACLGCAMIVDAGLARVVGGFMLAACALTLALLLGEIGIKVLPDSWLHWAYPAIQPLGRALMGVWLWRIAGRGPPRV